MQRTARFLAGIIAAAICVSAASWSRLPVAADDPQKAEEEIHRAPGATAAGSPAVADPNKSGRVQITVVDAVSDEPTHCRINVVGADGNYYEPAENVLAAWSLHRLGNRIGKGPFRYYGWFFYSNGTCEVDVAPGKVRVEVWKGFEYAPLTETTTVAAGETVAVKLAIQRVDDPSSRGWYSGDTHIHLDRRNDADDERCLDLAAAEDIRFAHILCMNDPRTYQPVMEQQIHHQMQGLGKKSERQRGIYHISSGQEYRANTFGHICLVGGSRLVEADGLKTDPNNWPPFGLLAEELHGIGGFAFHAHGGYGKEIYADVPLRATDGVELLQFAEYRDVGLEGWYHILNAGYRFPAVGACDYPYCRELGDCRTYVHIKGEPSFEKWNRGAAEGRSYFTTGPLLELTVNDRLPGDTLSLPAVKTMLRVKIRVQSPVAAVQEMRLIEGGEVKQRKELPAQYREQPIVWQTELTVDSSTWIAVQATAKSVQGREDVEAHTNPVYVKVGGSSPVRRASVEWLLKKLDERIAVNAARTFDDKERVLDYMAESRKALVELLAQ